jgi:hypothetical protein
MIKLFLFFSILIGYSYSQTPFDNMLPKGKEIRTLQLNNENYIIKNNSNFNIKFSYMILKDDSFLVYDNNDSLIRKYTFNFLNKKFWSVDPLANHPNQIGLSPYSAFWQNPIKYTDPDGRCPECDDETYVPIAEHVYTEDLEVGMKTSNGWEVVQIDEFDKTGYVGALYKGTFNGKTEYIYATRGTEPTSARDWQNNILQFFGFSLQYKHSVLKAEKLANNPKYKGVSFTGHSLGGGMASANALKTKGKAVTFNAAGLSKDTKERLNLGENADITAYIVRGEIVDYLQNNLLINIRAEGKIIELPATYIKDNQTLYYTLYPLLGNGSFIAIESITMLQRIENHGMENVTKSFNQFNK